MISTNRPYFWGEINFFRAFKECGFEPKVIFDVGSGHSGWSWDIWSLFPDSAFHLFEPLVDFKSYYKRCTADVLTKTSNVRVHKIALGDKNGWTQLGSDKSGYGASTLVTVPSKEFPEVFQVPIRRLDSYVAELDLPKPQILKLDVQGGEIAVLQGTGSLLGNVQLIQIETWLHRSYGEETPLLHEIVDYLSPIGFRLVEFGDAYYNELHQLCGLDAFFARLELLDQCREKLPRDRLIDDREL
jgi:FkbM family methyltransferase